MKLIVFKEEKQAIKALAFCCVKVSNEFHGPDGTIGLGKESKPNSFNGRLRIFQKRASENGGCYISYCPFCGTEIDYLQADGSTLEPLEDDDDEEDLKAVQVSQMGQLKAGVMNTAFKNGEVIYGN